MKIKKQNQKQKGISSSLGIVIIVIAAIVAVGGALAYRYMWSSDEPIDKMMMRTETLQNEIYEIEFEKKIIEDVGKQNYDYLVPLQGKFEEDYNGIKSDSMIKECIVFGDLNNDNIKDAVYVKLNASGGTGYSFLLIAILNENGNFGSVGMNILGHDYIYTHINSVVIKSNIITVDVTTSGIGDWQIEKSRQIIELKLSGEELVREKVIEIEP